MNKTILAAALAATILPAVPVSADPPPWAPAYGHRDHDRDDWRDRDERRDRREWRQRQEYREFRLSRRDHIWHGRDGRYYCRRSDGTTGLVVGAAVGGMVGRSLDDGRDRTLGTVLGMVGGGLLGRSVDRGDLRCR